jgi:hypothetical protein
MADRHKQDQKCRPTSAVLYDHLRITAQEAAIVAARAEGCTCAPEVTIAGVSAYLRHDQHCALLRRQDVN